jgi:HEPN domain-containing protein
VTDSANEAVSDLVERWLTKAAEDLGVATVLLDNPLVARWAVCFHAQQAAEKALKAILVQSSIEFPRSHSLERLFQLIPDRAAERIDRESLIRLTPWAVAGRYPEDIPTPSAQLAAELVADAYALLEIVSAVVGDRA